MEQGKLQIAFPRDIGYWRVFHLVGTGHGRVFRVWLNSLPDGIFGSFIIVL